MVNSARFTERTVRVEGKVAASENDNDVSRPLVQYF